MLTTEPEGRGQKMTLLNETQHVTTLESAVAVYRHLAPVPASFRGTTLPVAVLNTVPSTVNTIDNTDMGAKGLLGRGRAFAGLGWQPVLGSEKRHGVTRGKPPREHRKGLQKPARTLSRPRIPQQGSRPFCMAHARSRPTSRRQTRRIAKQLSPQPALMRPNEALKPNEMREETEPMTDTLIGPELREQACETGSDLPCREYDADLWFSEQPTELEFAKSLCTDCPVRLACLTGALERHEPWGVWGGEIFEKGNVVARKRPRGRPRKDAALIEQAAEAELAARTRELAIAGVSVS